MSRWVRRPDLHWRRTSRHVLVLTPASEEALVLDGSGTLVWDLLAEPLSIDDTAALIAEASQSETEQVRHDLAAVIHRLAAEDVVRSVP